MTTTTGDGCDAPLLRRSHGSMPAEDGDGEIGVTLRTRVHARYDAVVTALLRMAEGSYGSCIRCWKRIPYGRLMVMPESDRCLTCG